MSRISMSLCAMCISEIIRSLPQRSHIMRRNQEGSVRRRGFYDLAKAKAPIAMETLQRIAALYEIEARVRGKSANDRLAVRQAESKPLVTELRIWLEAQIAKLPARGPTA
jgi:hypothetical protein